MRRFLTTLLASGVLTAAAGSAAAATATTTFQVSATVISSCLVSANSLSFGNYQPGAGSLAVNTTLSVRCTAGTPFTISLNAGTTTGGSFAQRLMANGASTLQYNLYTSAALTTVWGDGSGTTGTVSGTGNGVTAGAAISEIVYGQLPDSATNQAVTPGGPFTDTITVTVTY